MRINKLIAQSGLCSRRKADELVASGKVKVNGAVMKEAGYDVKETDVVEALGQKIESKEELVYYALNKPQGYITSVSDDKGRETVLDLMTDVSARIFPVGRLDYDSAGLIIMTNDGALMNKLAHPRNKVFKTYMVEVAGQLTSEKLRQLEHGVVIEGKKTLPAKIKLIKQKGDMSLVEIKISEGRNRQVRKMFDAVSCKVTFLQRTAIGEVNLGRLHEGDYRKLTPTELNYLSKL